MKYIILIFSLFSVLTLQAQVNAVITEGACSGYDLTLDNTVLEEIDDCSNDIGFDMAAGQTYVLGTTNADGLLNGISTLDLILLIKGMQSGFESPEATIAADWDRDGAISSYDFVNMRRAILGIDTDNNVKQYTVVKADHVFPQVDWFDIDVDYSTLEVTTEDFENLNIPVRVLKTGDVNFSAQ